ncbi:MAG: GerMN domain-containing protein [Caldisericaceae bacterium]
MKKRKDVVRLFALFTLIVLIVGAVSFIISFGSSTNEHVYSVSMYFYDPIAKELVPKKIDFQGTVNFVARKVFEVLKNPENPNDFPTLPKELSLNSVEFKDGALLLDINTANVILTQKEEFIAFLSLANSLKTIDGVNEIKFLINSKPSDTFIRYVKIDKVLSNLVSTIPKFRSVYLYFLTPDLNNLAVEKREILDSPDPVFLIKEIVNELLYGSRLGLVSLLQKDFIESYQLKSFGIVEFNFTSKINELSLGSYTSNLLILSIVNSLTEIRDVQAVQFLVESNKVDDLFGSVNTLDPIRRFAKSYDSNFVVTYFEYNLNEDSVYVPVINPVKNIEFVKAFNLLLTPPQGLKTSLLYVNLESMRFKNNVLEITLTPKKLLDASLIDGIKMQLFLTYREFENIKEIDINLGEEAFILKR